MLELSIFILSLLVIIGLPLAALITLCVGVASARREAAARAAYIQKVKERLEV